MSLFRIYGIPVKMDPALMMLALVGAILGIAAGCARSFVLFKGIVDPSTKCMVSHGILMSAIARTGMPMLRGGRGPG